MSGFNGTEVWDVDAGKKLPHRPLPNVGPREGYARRRRLALSEDGRLVVTVDHNRRSATMWDTATGTRQTTFHRHAGDIRAIAFTPDGAQLAVVVDGWTVHYHPLRIPDLLALAKIRVTRAPTPEECQRYRGRPQCPPPPQ